MAWRWVLAAILVTSSLSFGSAHDDPLLSQWHFTSKTLINNVVLDPSTSRLYVGAVNALYQLDQSLHVEAYASTGPKNDNRQCTPPVTPACEEAVKTDNHNKLLLIHPSKDTLIVCGSLFRGICSLRNLSNVDQLLYFSDTKGEKTYVASAEESVSVVGVVSYYAVKDGGNFTVFLVGRGYGSHDSTKLISTRILQDHLEWVVFDNVIEASAVQASPFTMRYHHDFRHVFKDGGFVYFLFSRTLSDQDSGTKNFTFISRMCENDHNYYSYTELQLNCSVGNAFNKAQAVYVSLPGEALARNMSSSGKYGRVLATDKVMFVVFSSDDDSSRSALCLYPLKAVNQRLVEVIEACYSGNGNINSTPAVYSPYSNKKKEELCVSSSEKNRAITHRCGAEFLPSPLASRVEFGLAADPVFIKKAQTSGVWSAVAVTVETEHTVAFLGSTSGEVWKLHLSASPEIYGHAPGDNTGEKVNKNLLFNNERTHLYITTETKITKVPVQACHLKTDCKSCMSLKDPYCGWCVLKGKCTRRSDCPRSDEEYTWLWSPNRMCVQIQAFSPPNLSCSKTRQVEIDVPTLPQIESSDIVKCEFDSNLNIAVVKDKKITCSLPDPVDIPPTPDKQDYVAVPVRILVNGDVEVTSGEYKFYNCAAAIRKSENTPCIACVTSEWRCQWKAQEHTCADSDAEHLNEPQQADSCPQFENPEPKLVPVGHRIPISFEGKNLDIYAGRSFKIGTELMKNTEEMLTFNEGSKFKFNGFEFTYDKEQEVNVSFHIKDCDTEKKIDSTLTVVLYNCSLGREDCSLCKHAHPKYNCVWCPGVRSCVYRELCPSPEPALCPDPKITDIIPHFGPLNGKISVTIKGSNLGIKKEDIKKVTVAGVDCVHQEDRYSVSTSVVCEIGGLWPADGVNQGVVEVELLGDRRGRSEVLFTYRDPIPLKVSPVKGPAAGGTYVTISGTDLDTATKDDVAVTIGGTPCDVLQFGAEIVCETGANQGLKVPSEPLLVTVKYGKNTTKEVPVRFQYFEDPKVTSFNPKASFVCGGRRIVVVGSGFDLVQRASMKVLPSADESSPESNPVEYVQDYVSKNDTVLEFESPEVNMSQAGQLAFRTLLQLDNVQVELKNFMYHTNPTFDRLAKDVITETSIIIVTGHGFNKAMTAEEAQAFVGDAYCKVTILQEDKLILDAPSTQPKARSKSQRGDTSDPLDLTIKFGKGEWVIDKVRYEKKYEVPLAIIIPAVLFPMVLFIAVSVYCYWRKSQQAEREYEKVKHQLENLEESVRDRCKKEFTDLMIEMEDHTNDLSEARIPFLDYKTYTDRVFFLPSKDGANDVMITGKLDIPEARAAIVALALNQFSNLLNSKTFLINFIKTLESRQDFSARSRVYFASLLTVALHGKLEYYTDIMTTLLLELMEEHVHSKNPKLMLRRSETVVERMLCNWMSICLYQFLRDSAGEPLYKLFKAIKHQVEKGPVDAKMKKAKYTLNDTGLLGDDVEYCVLTLQVLVHGEGPDVTPVKVLNCDTISQVKEKIIEQVYRNLPYSQRPNTDSVALEWRPGSTGQILSDMDLTSQKEGRWKRLNTLAHYNVRDNATLVLSRVLHHRQFHQNPDSHEERNALLEDDKVFHLVRPADELDEVKSKRGSLKAKTTTKAITEIYLTRLLSVKGTLQQFVDDFFRSVLCSGAVVPPAVKYFFDFLDEQALKHENVEEETIHIWKTNSLPLRFWVNILKNPHFIFDIHVTEVVDASLSVIAQTFMDACTKTEHKLSRESPSNKLLYAKEISTYKKMVDDYYKGIRQMVPVSDQDMNTHLAEVSRQHTDKLNTQAALHQLYQYASKYYDGIIQALEEDPAAQSKQLTVRLQQIAAALENKVTDL
ncbi:plexin-B2 [Esox lucius]|nr:plexin-B2 [Esox lucius]